MKYLDENRAALQCAQDGTAQVIHLLETLARERCRGTLRHSTIWQLVVNLVLQHGSQAASVQNREGETLLHYAACAGKSEYCGLLLSHGAQVDARTFIAKETPLIYCVESGTPQCAEVLLRYGADANASTEDGRSVLEIAMYTRDPLLLNVLIRYGAEVNDRHCKRYGTSSAFLSLAVMLGSMQVLQTLLDAGAQMRARDPGAFDFAREIKRFDMADTLRKSFTT